MFVARFALIFVAASAAVSAADGQETVSVSSSISQVMIYLDRALVTRAANTSLPAGSSTIEFAGLPAALDEGSVAVSGKSDGTLTIEGIDIRQQFLTESANPKAQELERQIHELQDQKKSLAGQKNVLEEKREFFKNLSLGLGKRRKRRLTSTISASSTLFMGRSFRTWLKMLFRSANLMPSSILK